MINMRKNVLVDQLRISVKCLTEFKEQYMTSKWDDCRYFQPVPERYSTFLRCLVTRVEPLSRNLDDMPKYR